MKKGIVKFFNDNRGYGFIIEAETKKEFFFHLSGIANGDKLHQNDKVSFDTKDGKKGILAVNIIVD